MCTLLNTVLTEVLNSGIRKIRALIGKEKVKLSLLADSTPGKLQGINDNANSNSERINKLMHIYMSSTYIGFEVIEVNVWDKNSCSHGT